MKLKEPKMTFIADSFYQFPFRFVFG